MGKEPAEWERTEGNVEKAWREVTSTILQRKT